MGFAEWIKLISGVEHFNAHINAMKIISEEKDKKIAELEKIKQEHEKMKGSVISMDDFEVFLDRDRETLQQFIECVSENRDLKERIIFLEYELKKLKSKT